MEAGLHAPKLIVSKRALQVSHIVSNGTMNTLLRLLNILLFKLLSKEHNNIIAINGYLHSTNDVRISWKYNTALRREVRRK